MRTTSLFKIGDDQVMLIPDKLAYADDNIELDIARTGDVIVIRPVHRIVERNAE